MTIKPTLLFLAAFFTACIACAQETNPEYPSDPRSRKSNTRKPAAPAKTEYPVIADEYPQPPKPKKELGKFNYVYLRLGYPIASGNFHNPMAGVFPGSGSFQFRGNLKSKFQAGLEVGSVRHLFDVGTYMFRFGLNTGFHLYAFGNGNVATAGYDVTSDGIYMGKLAIGPQLTFKPVGLIRLGLFTRIGITGIKSDYVQRNLTGENSMEISAPDTAYLTRTHNMNVTMSNLAFTYDFGFEFSMRSLSIGASWSFIKARPASLQLYLPDEAMANSYYDITTRKNAQGQITSTTETKVNDIDPVIRYNMFTVTLGFAF